MDRLWALFELEHPVAKVRNRVEHSERYWHARHVVGMSTRKASRLYGLERKSKRREASDLGFTPVSPRQGGETIIA